MEHNEEEVIEEEGSLWCQLSVSIVGRRGSPERMASWVKCTVDVVKMMSRMPEPQTHEENGKSFSPGLMLRRKWLCIICATFNGWNIFSSHWIFWLSPYTCIQNSIIKKTYHREDSHPEIPHMTFNCHTNQHHLTRFIIHVREHATFTTPRR